MRDRKTRWSGVLCLLVWGGIAVVSFAAEPGTVSDIDGNVYQTVQIGNQIWMKENLRVTRYNDGTEILRITDPRSWQRNTAGAYCWYGNDESNAAVYGTLYNWHAAATGRLCPPGWRVPTDEDWNELIGFLREKGTEADTAGFAALPGGYRWWRSSAETGCFYEEGAAGYWWSSTEASESYAWNRAFCTRTGRFLRGFFPKGEGFSVRAVKVQE